MKTLALLLILCGVGWAQNPPVSGTIPSTAGSSCVSIQIGDKGSTVAINISGTWTGTIQPQAQIQNQAFANVQVTPSTSATAQSTITANGLYTASVAAYNTFQVCGNTVATGTAVVNINVSVVVASGSRGAGGGSVSSVFTRTGAVAAASGDYTVGQVTGAAPTASPTFTGTVTEPLLATTTNCAAVGTAANPSVASCVAASAGSFSCATAASTGSCTVNTTAVTANSEIFLSQREDTVTGTRLGVTCNTTATTVPPDVNIITVVAATSFTVKVGTISVNPECFSYYIVN